MLKARILLKADVSLSPDRQMDHRPGSTSLHKVAKVLPVKGSRERPFKVAGIPSRRRIGVHVRL